MMFTLHLTQIPLNESHFETTHRQQKHFSVSNSGCLKKNTFLQPIFAEVKILLLKSNQNIIEKKGYLVKQYLGELGWIQRF
jgi:hypothetical protein